LAKKLKKRFIETDKIIEEQEGKRITDIFKKYGESYFRRQETRLLKRISQKNNLVISCGGGMACNNKNLKIMKRSGIIFNLTAAAPTIYKRTRKYCHRPLLNVTRPLDKIKELLIKRRRYYQQADYILNTNNISIEKVVEEIIKKLYA
jgi:shikimate kinase